MYRISASTPNAYLFPLNAEPATLEISAIEFLQCIFGVSFVFEVNERFCEALRGIDDDRLIIAQDSAENIGSHVERLGFEKVDAIISAIPFVALPKELGYSIVRECHRCMKKGGMYIQVHYSLLTKKLYETVFGNVDVNWIPLNVPPAFVLVSEKV